MTRTNSRRALFLIIGLFIACIILILPFKSLAQNNASGPTGSGWVPPTQPLFAPPQPAPQPAAPEPGMSQRINSDGTMTNVPSTQMSMDSSTTNTPTGVNAEGIYEKR